MAGHEIATQEAQGERKPWHRRVGESLEAYRMFRLHLQGLPPRSVSKTVAKLQVAELERKVQAGELTALRANELKKFVGHHLESQTNCLTPAYGAVRAIARKYAWVERASAYDETRTQAIAERESQLLDGEIARSQIRRRQSRENAWKMAELMRRQAEMHLKASLDAGVPLAPKDLRDLGVLLDRLGMVEERAFKGLPTEEKDKLQQMGEDMAAIFDEIRARKALESEGIVDVDVVTVTTPALEDGEEG